MPVIDIDQIDLPVVLVRTRATVAADQQLEASIRHRGVMVPLIVRKSGNRFVVVDGERRLRAAREIGLSQIEVSVSHYAAQNDLADQVIANMVRAPLEPIDQWRAIVRLQAESGMTIRGAGEALGLSDTAIRRLDKLGNLHPDVLAAIDRKSVV